MTPSQIRSIEKGRSLYGPKPLQCPAKFEHCGDCNIYPCIIGQPAKAPPTKRLNESSNDNDNWAARIINQDVELIDDQKQDR
jgi:hypothetical protein